MIPPDLRTDPTLDVSVYDRLFDDVRADHRTAPQMAFELNGGPADQVQAPGMVDVACDQDAREAVERARRSGMPVPVLRLVGGDLRRAVLDAHPDAASGADVCLDLVSVLLDGRPHWFVSHLIARQDDWRGRVVAVANVADVGEWPLAPGADPADGLVEVFDGSAEARSRRLRRTTPSTPRRLDLGPARTVAARMDIELARPTAVWLDGAEAGIAWYLSVKVEPGALVCVIG